MRFARWSPWIIAVPLLVGHAAGAEEQPGAPREPAPLAARRHTLKDLRDQYVVKQQLDYSCGAAALATLMRYYFGEPVTEFEILRILESRLSEDEQKRKIARGYSLMDLKYVAESKGYQAAGFKLTIDEARQLAAPVIVHVRPFGYRHFAVLRGIVGDRVFLADPARGNMRISIDRFRSEWDGVVFVLGKPGEDAIRSHPLAVPRPSDAGSVLGLRSLLDLGGATTDVARRIRGR
ncbi:MAG TPA: C39 family peptidase [Methylomirabilota bacterium]|jgi:predicted double-glycine peptidase|nr:C39 family peptidase [Methylomirabilota bacterium]